MKFIRFYHHYHHRFHHRLDFHKQIFQRIAYTSRFHVQNTYHLVFTEKVSNTNFDNNSQLNPDVKRPQMTSIDLKTTSNEPVKNKKKKLKGGSVRDNVEIDEHYLDEILHNKNS